MRYVSKSLPILALTANSAPFHQYILTNSQLPMYEIGYEALLYSTHVHIADIFPGFSSFGLRNSSSVVVNNIFSDFIECNFPDFIVIYKDGSVFPLYQQVSLSTFLSYTFHVQVIYPLPHLLSQMNASPLWKR